MTLRLPKSIVDEMIAHARDDLPNECCGLITAKDGELPKLHRTRNAEASPFRYVIHPLDLLKVEKEMDDKGSKLLVIYHSHVASEAYPSPTDVRMAAWPGSDPPEDLYPGTYYVLVSLKDADSPAVRAYQIRAGQVTEEALEID
ncbi:MAG TPA: M67 family metallopeptidase [Dehalococcoidia bacterium]|jgi:proteasome lid subunit RPN8/RPN11|nr:M67 family metallopeptidase [Dehalococcoidia bacterium]